MQKLKQLYRSDYAGENIITSLHYVHGEWNPTVEFAPSHVSNSYTTSQAIAIGNGESRLGFDLQLLANHKGGLLATDRLQTYGCNALSRDTTVDFLVVTSNAIADEVINSDYSRYNIVYANADLVLKHPGHFYLIPQNLMYDAGAIAVYMACFDGHKKVFLMGYDQYHEQTCINNVYKDTEGYLPSTATENGEFFVRSLSTIMQTYHDVEFVRIVQNEEEWIHPSFSPLANYRQINYRQFVVEADIG